MKTTCSRNPPRIWTLSGRRPRAWASPLTASTSGLPPATSSTPSIPRAGRPCARSMSPRMPERPSTASTCSRSPRTASRRSIRRPAACSPRSRRPAAAATPGSPGPKARSGSGSIATAKIHQIDPETGAILRTIESNRFVTGVTWVDGELWHATWEGDESDLRRVDPANGRSAGELDMPAGAASRGSSPMAAIGSSAAAGAAARCAPSAGPSEAPARAARRSEIQRLITQRERPSRMLCR